MAIIVDARVASASPTAPASSSIRRGANFIDDSLSIEVGRSYAPPLLIHQGERRSAEPPCARSRSSQALSSRALPVGGAGRHGRLPCVPAPKTTASLLVACAGPLHREAMPPKKVGMMIARLA